MLEITKCVKQTNDRFLTIITDEDLKITYKVITNITLGKRGKYLFDSSIEPKINTKTLLKTSRDELASMVNKAARARKQVIKKAEDNIRETIFNEVFN